MPGERHGRVQLLNFAGLRIRSNQQAIGIMHFRDCVLTVGCEDSAAIRREE
jgi:hypothetical protein